MAATTVVTISRQLGSGGSWVGHQAAAIVADLTRRRRAQSAHGPAEGIETGAGA